MAETVAPEPVKLFGPVQLKVVPVVVELAVRETEVVVQVNVPGVAIATLAGTATFCATVVEAVVLQPVAVIVAVTV